MSPVGMLQALWRYRGFVAASVAREFHARSRGSALGFVWNLIGPIGNVIVFTVIFAQVMHARLPGVGDVWGYGIFLCSGIFAWGLFVEIVQRGAGMFIEHGNLLKKASFPKSSLPVIVVLSALVNFAVAFGVFMVFLAVDRPVSRVGRAGSHSGHRVAGGLRHGPRDVSRHAQRVFARRRPGSHGPHAVLVLAHAHRVSDFCRACVRPRLVRFQSDGADRRARCSGFLSRDWLRSGRASRSRSWRRRWPCSPAR